MKAIVKDYMGVNVNISHKYNFCCRKQYNYNDIFYTLFFHIFNPTNTK